MIEPRTRRRLSRPTRIAIYLVSVVLLGSVPFAGVALARDGVPSAASSFVSPAKKDDKKDDKKKSDKKDDAKKAEDSVPANVVKGTPCTKDAVACVSLGAKKSWIFKDGEIVHGPVSISTGGPGKETPVGDHVVQWKDRNHKSGEFFVPAGCKPGTPKCEGAPMNFAVFFAEGGIAFHEGRLSLRSSGCVRLIAKEAEFYYNTLQLGDKVQVRG